MSANDYQVGGIHYKTDGLQHWDFVWILKLDYFQGQITKYVVRHRDKGGINDLKKAQHFLAKYIELLEVDQVLGLEPGPSYVDQDGSLRKFGLTKPDSE